MFEIPTHDRFRAMTDGYEVSGKRIAEHLDCPCDDHPFRRFPLGDLLWKQPGVIAD